MNFLQFHRCVAIAIATYGAAMVIPVHAVPFEIAAAPARFEISAKGGQRVGQSLDIHNVGTVSTDVALRTIDWTYTEDGKISYHDELLPDSCRPWVTLQRRTVKIGPRSKAAFRFEVQPPADAPRGECRFMVAIEGVEPATRAALERSGIGLSLPVSGRIAVTVYVMVNGAKPKFEMGEVAVRDVQGVRTPVVTVRNVGDAHGRLEGALGVVGADGAEFDLVPDGSPVLPGQSRTLALNPRSDPGGKPIVMKFPLRAKGSLDWDEGSFQINAEFK